MSIHCCFLQAKKSSRGINRRQSSTLIYYLEDAARKEAEINRLRKENNELEVKIHTIEKECFQQMQLYAQLQQDIQRFICILFIISKIIFIHHVTFNRRI